MKTSALNIFSISLSKTELEIGPRTVLLIVSEEQHEAELFLSEFLTLQCLGSFYLLFLSLGNKADPSELSISRKLRPPHQVCRLPFQHASHHQLARDQTEMPWWILEH